MHFPLNRKGELNPSHRKESELSTIFEVTHIPHFIMISKDGGITPGAGAINEETIRYFIERLLSK